MRFVDNYKIRDGKLFGNLWTNGLLIIDNRYNKEPVVPDKRRQQAFNENVTQEEVERLWKSVVSSKYNKAVTKTVLVEIDKSSTVKEDPYAYYTVLYAGRTALGSVTTAYLGWLMHRASSCGLSKISILWNTKKSMCVLKSSGGFSSDYPVAILNRCF